MSAFKVIIVGASIAGLTLARILERYEIDYIVLEKHDAVAPQLGASIGILPQGERILDQLGMYERIEQKAMAMLISQSHGPDRRLLASPHGFGKMLGELSVLSPLGPF
ncbi:uncharacterized protein N7459_000478 [Penicillium hispanicum]|uniref:uncharacterized protein n=1 Tax=Penicillium hispanicum TaxID=1080232 RepID=UPI0025401312|nr:uncharacterized protein N7459_000478 [Penicillium hispanicum]KAJ5594270.1 hypothetical protein N7459_000478 [Penicillium hispanicum]